MGKHDIIAAIKPYTKLRQQLVHPKDRIPPDNKCNIIYEITCQTCNKVYIGETGRSFSTRRNEHKKECEKETAARLTRAQRQKAQESNLKSAISDHCKINNHIMDWDNARIITSESNKYQRWIKESIEIRRRGGNTINRDEGAYTLSHVWDSLLQRPLKRGGRGIPGATARKATPTRK